MSLLGGDTPRETAIAWCFVLVQFALLVAILLLPSGDAWVLPAGLATAARWTGLAGMAVLILGAIGLGRSLTALPTPVPHGELRTGGLYRFVRHPIYTGVLALSFGAAVPSGSPAVLAAAIALTGWLALKARWEEQRLRHRYPSYDAYAGRTPRFVPGWPFGADRHQPTTGSWS